MGTSNEIDISKLGWADLNPGTLITGFPDLSSLDKLLAVIRRKIAIQASGEYFSYADFTEDNWLSNIVKEDNQRLVDRILKVYGRSQVVFDDYQAEVLPPDLTYIGTNPNLFDPNIITSLKVQRLASLGTGHNTTVTIQISAFIFKGSAAELKVGVDRCVDVRPLAMTLFPKHRKTRDARGYWIKKQAS